MQDRNQTIEHAIIWADQRCSSIDYANIVYPAIIEYADSHGATYEITMAGLRASGSGRLITKGE